MATAIDLKALVSHMLSLMKSTVSDYKSFQGKDLVDAAVDGDLVSGSFSPAVEGVVSQTIPFSPFQCLLLLSNGPEEPTLRATTSVQYPFENPKTHVTAARIESTLRKLVNHHPILHTRLQRRKGDGKWIQEIDDKDTKKSRSGKTLYTFRAPVTLGPMTCCQSSNVAFIDKASLRMVSTE